MGKKSSPPPQPDPSIGLAAQANMEMSKVQREIAAEQATLAREQMAESRRQYDEQQAAINRLMPTYEENLRKQTEMTDLTMNQARKAEEDYNTLYRPLEQRLVNEANVAGSAEEQALAAGRVGADVQRQIDAQREMQGRQMGQMGINPNSGRFESMNRADAIRSAAARSGAMTGARESERARGDAMRANMANFGRGIAGAASGNAGSGYNMAGGLNNAANFGLNMNSANNAALIGSYGAGLQGLGMSGNSLAGAGSLNNSAASIYNNQYQNQLAAWKAKQQSRSSALGGIGSLVGAGVGLFAGGGLQGAALGSKIGGGLFG